MKTLKLEEISKMSVIINLPSSLNISEFEVNMIIASKLFKDGKLSSGQAAKIVGLSKQSFIEILGKYEVSVLESSESELESDIRNA